MLWELKISEFSRSLLPVRCGLKRTECLNAASDQKENEVMHETLLKRSFVDKATFENCLLEAD